LRKAIKISFADLVKENKNELLKEQKAMERIEERLDQKGLEKTK